MKYDCRSSGQVRRSCPSSRGGVSLCWTSRFQVSQLLRSSSAHFLRTRKYQMAFSFFTNPQSPSAKSSCANRKSFAAAGSPFALAKSCAALSLPFGRQNRLIEGISFENRFALSSNVFAPNLSVKAFASSSSPDRYSQNAVDILKNLSFYDLW
jgi:hypothetical protein